MYAWNSSFVVPYTSLQAIVIYVQAYNFVIVRPIVRSCVFRDATRRRCYPVADSDFFLFPLYLAA